MKLNKITKESSSKVFITGGCGYVGSALIPKLLRAGYEVTILDLMLSQWKPSYTHPKLHVIKGDIRDRQLLRELLIGQDSVIHLAFISNDPEYQLPEWVGREINIDAFQPLVELSLESGVHRFILASSCSIYGKQDVGDPEVTEDSLVNPLTAYAESKLACEQILLEYNHSSFCRIVVRPATICGPAERQRFDLIFNYMVACAYQHGEIRVPNPKRIRPCLHINDMARLYLNLLSIPDIYVANKTWNVAFENRSVLDSAHIIRNAFGGNIKLTIEKGSDNRSYRVSSKKICQDLNFKPKYTLYDAVLALHKALAQGHFPNPLTDHNYYNIHLQKQYSW